MTEEIQKKIQAELTNFKNLQKEYNKHIHLRNHLDAQLNENNAVKVELDLLKDDDEVYKKHGPVLIKTDLVESKQNVNKRIDYIGKELKRIDESLEDLDKKQESTREKLHKLQMQFQMIKPN